MTLQEAFEQAVAQHQSGRLRQAEELYRQILAQDPNNPDALHLLGVLGFQAGHHQTAIELIRRAIAIQPSPTYLDNLGEMLLTLRRFDEAVAVLQRASALVPQEMQIQLNLAAALRESGRIDESIACFERVTALQQDNAPAQLGLGLALYAKKRYTEAAGAFRRAIALKPDYSEAYTNLGNIEYFQGRVAEAEAAYRAALVHNPQNADALSNLGPILTELGRAEEAAACCRGAIAIDAKSAGAHSNLGSALNAMDRCAEAVESLQRALAIEPNFPEALVNLGNALARLGRLRESESVYRTALKLRENYPAAHSNLAIALDKMGRTSEAIAECRRAIEILPDFADAYTNLGISLNAQGHVDEAIAALKKSLQIRPNHRETLTNLANVQKDAGRLDDALVSYDQGVAVQPTSIAASNRLYTLSFHPDFDAPRLLDEARAWNRQFAAPLAKEIHPHDNDRDPNRRLRIGYVSPDFREHCQAFFTLPLLGHHDKKNVEIFCYASVTRPDRVTDTLRSYADVWRDVLGKTDAELANIIRNDRIDVLVDLTMHMASHRLLAFAGKPAPVQVSWLAYPGTTGVDAIDYRFTDPYLDPPGQFDEQYSEQSYRLPDTFWCYQPMPDDSIPNVPPVKKNGHVTFGCLNNFCKVNPGVLDLWAKVLQAIPDSRLILLAPQGEARRNVLEKLPASRVEFVDRQSHLNYMLVYHRIDIGLDTFPYSGHTTSLDSFWMGVPVVTLVGSTVVGRAGWSQLCNLNEKSLAATTPHQFVQIAGELAGDETRLAELRSTLRERMKQSPLMDAARFTRGIEDAYRTLWKRWGER